MHEHGGWRNSPCITQDKTQRIVSLHDTREFRLLSEKLSCFSFTYSSFLIMLMHTTLSLLRNSTAQAFFILFIQCEFQNVALVHLNHRDNMCTGQCRTNTQVLTASTDSRSKFSEGLCSSVSTFQLSRAKFFHNFESRAKNTP